MSVKRIRNAATGLMATVALTMTAFVGLSGSAQAVPDRPPDNHGCPFGAVCVYPDDNFLDDPTYVFYSYDSHRIYGQYGTHRVFNNQSGLAFMRLCEGSAGTSCGDWIWPQDYVDVNLTPINSIKLFAT